MLFAFCLLVLLSCGYVGEPLPPALHIPLRVTDLRMMQLAGRIVLEFTIPELTTEGLPVKLGSIELRAAPASNQAFNEDNWNARSKLLEPDCAEPGPCRLEVAAQPWIGQELFARVRLVSPNGRAGDWSDFAVLRVIQPLETPSALRAEAVPQGVRLTWQDPGQPDAEYRIRRRVEGEDTAAVVAAVRNTEWIDTQTQYRSRYEYSVEAAVKAGGSQAVSEVSEPVAITPEDRFPPAVPAGLKALAGIDSIELAWDRNTEEDLAGYFVYRAAVDQAFERIAGPLPAPSYSDRSIERGKMYRYTVSSVDRLENESERSQPVEIALP